MLRTPSSTRKEMWKQLKLELTKSKHQKLHSTNSSNFAKIRKRPCSQKVKHGKLNDFEKYPAIRYGTCSDGPPNCLINSHRNPCEHLPYEDVCLETRWIVGIVSQSRNTPFIQYSLLSLRWNPWFGLKSKISKVELEPSFSKFTWKKNTIYPKTKLIHASSTN